MRVLSQCDDRLSTNLIQTKIACKAVEDMHISGDSKSPPTQITAAVTQLFQQQIQFLQQMDVLMEQLSKIKKKGFWDYINYWQVGVSQYQFELQFENMRRQCNLLLDGRHPSI